MALMVFDTAVRYALALISYFAGIPGLVVLIGLWVLAELVIQLLPFISVRYMVNYLRLGAMPARWEDAHALLYLPLAAGLAVLGHALIAMALVVHAWVLWTAQRKRRAYGQIVRAA